MSSKLKVLQVIPKLGYGGAETGCYDLAHYLYEQNCASYIVTSGGVDIDVGTGGIDVKTSAANNVESSSSATFKAS